MSVDPGNQIGRLLEIMAQLRDPSDGCEWDVEQTFATIAPYTVEEAYEVADAIERNDHEDLLDELGDLLLQVVFHSQMASELELFEFNDVARTISDKMVRRHPHVFADKVYANVGEQKADWERIKTQERNARNRVDNPPSALDSIAVALPALSRAQKLQKRAAAAGMDWHSVDGVFDKLEEELAELRSAVSEADADAVTEELGDLLFTVVNIGRHLGVNDPESALRGASKKFEQRFRRVESAVANSGQVMSELELSELDKHWLQAKAAGTDKRQ